MKMAAKLRSQVFWLSYRLDPSESVSTIARIARSVILGSPGICGDVVVRDGQTMVDMVVCTPVPQRISAVCTEPKWRLKGARGAICDARWPAEGESPRDFLRKWADAVCGYKNEPFGSRRELDRAMDAYYDKERKRIKRIRVKAKRKRRRPLPSARPSPRATPAATPAARTEPAGVTDMSQDEVGGIPPLDPHEFTGVDFGSATEGLLPPPRSHPRVRRRANGTAAQDPFLCGSGISTFAIDQALMGWGVFPTDECSWNVSCDFMLDGNWGWNGNVNAVSVETTVALEDLKDPLDVFDLI